MAAPDRTTRRLRWMTWALVASLGLNLLGLGVIGGALIKGPPPGPPPGPSLWHYARSLPDPYRRDLGRALRDTRGDWIGPREALRNQSKALAAALTADPFDPAAVATVLKAQTQVTRDLSARGTDMLLAQIARMSAEERAAYAAALQADLDRGPPGPRPHD